MVAPRDVAGSIMGFVPTERTRQEAGSKARIAGGTILMHTSARAGSLQRKDFRQCKSTRDQARLIHRRPASPVPHHRRPMPYQVLNPPGDFAGVDPRYRGARCAA